MLCRTTCLVALLSVHAALAQISAAESRSKIIDVHYPRLAEYARILGDVHLKLAAGLVSVLSGHPLLAPTAVESAKLLGSIQGQTDIDLIYHFVLVDTARSVPTWVAVKRGNAFERAILRMFGFKAEKVVLDYQCQEGDPPASDLKVSGTTIEIWVYGRTHCLQTQAAELLARR